MPFEKVSDMADRPDMALRVEALDRIFELAARLGEMMARALDERGLSTSRRSALRAACAGADGPA